MTKRASGVALAVGGAAALGLASAPSAFADSVRPMPMQMGASQQSTLLLATAQQTQSSKASCLLVICVAEQGDQQMMGTPLGGIAQSDRGFGWSFLGLGGAVPFPR